MTIVPFFKPCGKNSEQRRYDVDGIVVR